jgi:hypothetical protein
MAPNNSFRKKEQCAMEKVMAVRNAITFKSPVECLISRHEQERLKTSYKFFQEERKGGANEN